MKSIIVEDDPSMVIEYEMILDKKAIEVSRVFKNAEEAYKAIVADKPDFLILDIHLDEGQSGLDLATKIRSLSIPTLFVTGFPKSQFYNEALSLEAESFLVKPFNPISLEFQIDKIIQKANSFNQFLFVKHKNNHVKLPFNNIQYVEIDGNYSTLVTPERKYVLKKSLRKISEELNMNLFIRVHRSLIVNKAKISEINFNLNSLLLLSGEQLKIGNNYIRDLRKFMQESGSIKN